MIDKLMRARTLVGVTAVLLLASGVAVAATDTGSRPAVSQEETSTSSTSVDPSSTTSTSVDDSTTSSTEATTSTTVAPGGGATTSTAPEAERHDNHGACVSQAAHDTPPGPDHGKTVSSVAQSDCGKQTTATTEANENENEPAEHGTEPAEQENEHHGDNSGPGSSNSGHGSDHGGHGSD